MSFKSFWKTKPFDLPTFEKAEKLSRDELVKVRELISTYQARNWRSSQIIEKIQGVLQIDQYRAQRVYDTEVKRRDVVATRELGKQVGFTKYGVVISPNACALCRRKTDNGAKIFSDADIHKTGYGQFVPWHPNCFCIAIPLG